MKAIKFLCAAMMCGVLTTGFSSCSKDDDGLKGPAVKMQLEGITITESGSNTTLSNFIYDNQGRLTSYDVNDNGDKETVTYAYYSSHIERNGGYNQTFQLSNGLITSVGSDVFEYSNGNMVKWSEGQPADVFYTWENGNPIRETVRYNFQTTSGVKEDITNFGYSDLPCYIGNLQTLLEEYASVDVELMGDNLDPFLQQQGYFGNLPKNLVTSGKSKNSEWHLTYEINANGYPTKITGKEDRYSAVMTLTWK